jgi:hypothetical protein
MFFLEAVQGLRSGGMMAMSVMHHAPDVANQRVMAGGNLT